MHLDLIARARAGDRSAFESLLRPLLEPATRFAYGMLHDREEAEDAVQEAALKAWRKLDRLREGLPMKPWFLGIVANQCRTTRRGRWWSVIRQEAPTARIGADPTANFARNADLRQALRQLGRDQLQVVLLRYYLDLPIEEVARTVGISVPGVKSRLHRALAKLRPHLLETGPEEVAT
jgi:RNA polymerase sigma factor (sigma-70 family)